ncbi:hypothetical protein S7335_3661 [Synechococcus sp. PCC 7335]|uniref:hypothetical protein n=1 Tax=Synechococcus sp. (strain ATCC 29403 / PCC 7335) TaxID=91464 RepID=UPI00017ECE7C|nr:hypothetical protein [Synechococcus sp. PCC 7335]EDX85958.1 hypothetical protein S7335_3661 [Synechococcus sp. PCC 7335]
MKYWEFLIQKEGDETWLPLGTHRIELLEGRYRIVAHTHRTNSPIDIRISRQASTGTPPCKQVFSRSDHTNEAGLAVVIPYTYLEPGQWEIACGGCNTTGSSDIDSSDDWRCSLQINVFAPTEESGPEESGPDWSTLASDKTEAVDDSRLLNLATTVNPDLPLIHAQSQLRNQSHNTGLIVETEVYEISLCQSAFLAQNDQPISIMGRVRSLSALSVDQDKSQLCIRLREPETTQMIMEAYRPINLARLPADFKIEFQLPRQLTTQIVLGEVSLHSDVPESDAQERNASERATSETLLCSAAFTITAGITQLLEATVNRDLDSTYLVDSDEGTSIDHQLEDANHTDDACIEEDQLPPAASPLFVSPHNVSSPAVGVVLPPHTDQLAYTTPTDWIDLPPPSPNLLIVSDPQQSHSQQDSRSIDSESPDITANNLDGIEPGLDQGLNKISSNELDLDELSDKPHLELDKPDSDKSGSSDSVELPLIIAKPAQFIGTSLVDNDLEATEITALLEDMNNDLEPVVSPANTASPSATSFLSDTPEPPDGLSDDLIDETELATDPESDIPEPTQTREAITAAFKSLKLRERFMHRLSALAHNEIGRSTRVAEDVHTAGASLEDSQTIGEPNSLADKEVVIFDERPAVESVLAEPGILTASLDPSIEDSPSELPYHQQPLQSTTTPPQQQRSVSRTSRVDDVPLPVESESSIDPSPAADYTPEAAADEGSDEGSTPYVEETAEELPEMVLPIISVPGGDLVAGNRVAITVHTRSSVFRPFIKLWMIDRQSRSLVCEPQLLTDLEPDILGDLQTSTELLVPMNCLEVQIAAIAIDMATQQESHKAIVNRRVVPPV